MLGAIVLTSCAVTQQPAIAPLPPPDEYGVTEFFLQNGMKIIVKEDHRAPLAITQFWYRVGSSDEHSGITGISHALEHMMFKGTPKYPADALTEVIKREGGRYNAFTGPDYTAYYEIFEKSRLPLSFELESDRMVNLILREQDFEKEIEVVKEERRLRTEDKARSKVYEQFYAVALPGSPYGNPVIGRMNDLDNLKLEDLRAWYKKWYHPGNAFVLVAGDVEPEEVRRLAIEYLEHLPAAAEIPRKPRREPMQRGERRIVVAAPAEKKFWVQGYRVPNFKTAQIEWEPYALAALSAVLSGSSSARFQKNIMRDKKIALGVASGYSPFSVYDDLFIIQGTPFEEVSIEQLEEAVAEEIDKIKTELVPQQEWERIKTRMAAAEIYGRDSIRGQAYTMGRLEALGAGWRTLYEKFDRIKKITPQQIQEVARKYLIKESRTVAVLDPQPVSSHAVTAR